MENGLLSLQELQKANLELLTEFDAICRENEIRYDICGGTLLGAVRHHGFIPWDDDVDVSMPRPDYEKLYKLYFEKKIQLPEGRALISNKDRTFARHFGRYIRKDIIVESEYSTDSDNQNVGIDIFTVDGIESDRKKVIKKINKIWKLRKLVLIKLSRPGTSSRGNGIAITKNLVRTALKPVSLYGLVDRMENMCHEIDFDQAGQLGCLNSMYPLRDLWDSKEEYLPQTEFEFEGRRFPGFENYDIYLKNLYGNYMQMPPEEKRVAHPFKAYCVDSRKI